MNVLHPVLEDELIQTLFERYQIVMKIEDIVLC